MGWTILFYFIIIIFFFWGGGGGGGEWGLGNYQTKIPAQQKERKKIVQSEFTHLLTDKR